MEYDNTNTGAFFKNDRKETSNHPDYKGSVNVNGVDYWISGWIKPTKADASKRFMSLAVNAKEKQQETRAPAPSRAPSHDAAKARQLPKQSSGFDDMTDDVPF